MINLNRVDILRFIIAFATKNVLWFGKHSFLLGNTFMMLRKEELD